MAHKSDHLPTTARKIGMTGAESFWFIMQCLAFGAGYFAKLPIKKALADYGFGPELNGPQSAWYTLMCLAFGAGYFAKVIASKAISEMPGLVDARQRAITAPNSFHRLPPPPDDDDDPYNTRSTPPIG